MSLGYTLLVNGAVYGSQSARNAYRFACALIEKGHRLNLVFFYQEGVNNGSNLVVPANDEFNLTSAWQELAERHQVRIETCVAAALRRGVIGEQEAELHQKKQYNLAEAFEQAGLGSLAEALLIEDRVVQF